MLNLLLPLYLEPVNDNFILVTDTYMHGIYQLDLTKHSQKVSALPLLDSVGTAPLGIGYDPVETKVYWSDAQENIIYRASLYGEMKEVVIRSGGDENNYSRWYILTINQIVMIIGFYIPIGMICAGR